MYVCMYSSLASRGIFNIVTVEQCDYIFFFPQLSNISAKPLFSSHI